MSQQYMDFDKSNHSIQAVGSEERGASYYHDSSASLPGQKLFPDISFAPPSPRQRFALAIVSLVLWAILFFIAVIFVVITPSSITIPSTIPGGYPTVMANPNLQVLYPLLGLGLLMFSIIAIVVNILFNRKR